jgi:hypothetical protein
VTPRPPARAARQNGRDPGQVRARGPEEERLGVKARTVGWGLVWYAAVSFAGGFFAQHAMAASGIQAALAEWGASRLGVAWSDPGARPDEADDARAVARRAAWGFAAGGIAASLLVTVAVVSGAATLARGRVAVVSTLVALLDAAFVAVRDELLLHGLVLRVVGARPRWAALGACGLASAAAALGASPTGVTAPALVAAALGGVAFGALWLGDRGAWRPVCAHAAWLWVTGSLSRGALVDVRAASTAWGGGAAGIEAGWVGVAVVASLALAAAYGLRRGGASPASSR